MDHQKIWRSELMHKAAGNIMQTVLERLVRNTAAVGISAAMLGLEIGTRLLRLDFMEGRAETPRPRTVLQYQHPPAGPCTLLLIVA